MHITKFQKTVQGTEGDTVLQKTFTAHELSSEPSIETLAGFFAAKEAVIKALDVPAGSWLDIEIVKGESGRPEVRLAEPSTDIDSSDLSISHNGEYAMATAVFLFSS